MNYQELEDYKDLSSRYVKFEKDHEEKEFYFYGWKVIANSFYKPDDPKTSKTTVAYQLKTLKNNDVEWTQGSPKVAAQVIELKLQPGDKISIMKIKKGEYLIKKLPSAEDLARLGT